MAQQEHMIASWLLLLRKKAAAYCRLNAKQRKQTRCDAQREYLLRMVLTGQIEAPSRQGLHTLEGTALRLPVEIGRIGDDVVFQILLRIGSVNHHQPVGIPVRQ